MSLREACVQEALAIIETDGVESLSLREVSRRLGVSHQAPYKHFSSRDHILAEVVKRAFDAFAAYLSHHADAPDPRTRLEQIGRAYLAYAQAHPLHYKLMFNTPLPNPSEHSAMMESAQHAFAMLRDCLAGMVAEQGKLGTLTDLSALFVWSTVHGLASILQTQVLETLALPSDVLGAAVNHILASIEAALATTYGPSGG